MEQYIVSARKYRPSTFDSVVGQRALTTTLKNAIATDRLAHAYLFCGSRGVGKTSCARIFAKTINCTNRTANGEACNECDSCRQFNENRSLNIIELDAASHNGVEDIKSLIEQVMVPPTVGKYRVFIIDEVHMLTSSAFNAFLKTLEEPPSYVVFVLATTEKHKIIPTILSRCQIYDFNRISIQDMVDHLKFVASSEGITAEPAALNVIAQKADGAMRDALSIFDQVAASSRGNVTYQSAIDNLNILDHSYYARLVDAFVAQDVAKALLIYKEVREKGFDSQFFINGLGLYLRDLMVACDPSTIVLLDATDDVRAEMAERSAKLHPTFLYKAMDLCNDADFNFRQATNKQFLIELTLIKLCQLLSPSPENSGSDEGQLKPLPRQGSAAGQPAAAAPQAQTATPRANQTPAPAASTPVHPAPAPVHAPIPQPTHSAPKMKVGGLSIKKNNTAEAPHPDEPAQEVAAEPTVQFSAVTNRHEPYTRESLMEAWNGFIAEHPTEHLLINTMRAAELKSLGGDRYELTTANDIQCEIVHNSLPELLSYLRDKLRNDAISIETKESASELSPSMWTEAQVYAFFIENNPRAKEFVEKYKLRLV